MHERSVGAPIDSGRQERLAATLALLQRRFGPHVIRRGAHDWIVAPVAGTAPLSTGVLGLDLLLGGLPRGKLTEIAGPEGSGVEIIGLAALAACQRAGGLAILVDPESSLDPDALAALSIDVERLILAYPASAVSAWTILTALCRANAADLVLVASLPAFLALPRAGWSSTSYPFSALPKRLWRLSAALRGRATAVVLLNRTTLLQDDRRTLDERLETVGGPAIAQMASVRIGLAAPTLVCASDETLPYLQTHALVVKHQGRSHGPPVPLAIGARGPLRAHDLVALGLQSGCLARTPLGLVFGDHVLGRSRDRAARTIARETELAVELEERVRQTWPPLTPLPHESEQAP